jgi:hypothetical protein
MARDKTKRELDRLVRAGAGSYNLNQHAPRYDDRRTRRNRDRAARRRSAIADQH